MRCKAEFANLFDAIVDEDPFWHTGEKIRLYYRSTDQLLGAMDDLLQDSMGIEIILSTFLLRGKPFLFDFDENGRDWIRRHPNICHFKGFHFTHFPSLASLSSSIDANGL